MLERVRSSLVVSLLVLIAYVSVLGGKDLVHYTFAHNEAAHNDQHAQECCKPDHRLPHFHAEQYCFLCDIDVSVTLHTDTFHLASADILLWQEIQTHADGTYSPSFTGDSFLRGPPVGC